MYWHVDSIAKQAVMLADKSGLRPKGSSKMSSSSEDLRVLEMNREIGSEFEERMAKMRSCEDMTDEERAKELMNKYTIHGR